MKFGREEGDSLLNKKNTPDTFKTISKILFYYHVFLFLDLFIIYFF